MNRPSGRGGRTGKVADLIRGELATIFQREMRDPRVRLASVTDVQVSRDLSHARVLVSVLGEDDQRLETIEVLKGARGFVRSTLARRVHLRTVPELLFELDRGPEHSQRITELLETLDVDSEGT